MKTSGICLVIAAGLAATSGYAACEMPTLVSAIPDGATATQQELLAVQSEIKAYVAAMDDYIACQSEEMEAGSENATDDYLYLMQQRIETARSEVDSVASRFNDQVTAFRAQRQGATGLR